MFQWRHGIPAEKHPDRFRIFQDSAENPTGLEGRTGQDRQGGLWLGRFHGQTRIFKEKPGNPDVGDHGPSVIQAGEINGQGRIRHHQNMGDVILVKNMPPPFF
jgi:hypothetical protein